MREALWVRLITLVKMVVLELKVWVILNRKGRQKVPILNDQSDMPPILNGNLSILSIRLKLKKDPFPSNLCSHICPELHHRADLWVDWLQSSVPSKDIYF